MGKQSVKPRRHAVPGDRVESHCENDVQDGGETPQQRYRGRDDADERSEKDKQGDRDLKSSQRHLGRSDGPRTGRPGTGLDERRRGGHMAAISCRKGRTSRASSSAAMPSTKGGAWLPPDSVNFIGADLLDSGSKAPGQGPAVEGTFTIATRGTQGRSVKESKLTLLQADPVGRGMEDAAASATTVRPGVGRWCSSAGRGADPPARSYWRFTTLSAPLPEAAKALVLNLWRLSAWPTDAHGQEDSWTPDDTMSMNGTQSLIYREPGTSPTGRDPGAGRRSRPAAHVAGGQSRARAHPRCRRGRQR